MKNLNDFFESLASNASRNFKIEQLTLHSNNEVLREVVRLALDPFTQFYQRKIPAYTPRTESTNVTLKFALDSLYDLSSRQVTGNAAIDHLRAMLEVLSADDAKVIERIIQKDLKCGVDVSTANKVWMGLIHEYPCMLCSPFEQKLVDKISFPAYAQLKMDGMRFNAIVESGKVEFKTRNGRSIDLLGRLDAAFIAMAAGNNCVFDGELIVKHNGVILDRKTGNGILNKAVKGTISLSEAELVCAVVWDYIPLTDFKAEYSALPYSLRFAKLTNLPERVSLVPSQTVNDLEHAQKIFKEYYDAGEEGIIQFNGDEQ